MALQTRPHPVSLVRFLKAAAGSGAPNTDVPHRSRSALADRRSATLLSSTPPSNCTLTLGRRTRRKRRIRSTESGISSGRRRARALPDWWAGPQHTGVQDAVNLGWKLAQVVNATSPESLLDTFHGGDWAHPLRCADRRPARHHVRAAEYGRASQAVRRDDVWSGHSYDLGEGHPLLGRRMPDLDLVTASGPLRVFTPAARRRPCALQPR